MSDSPETIRADIDRTREEFGQDVDALADKVSPSKAVHRQTDKIKNALGSVRDRVMGAADDAHDSLSQTGASVSDSVSDAKDQVVSKTQGNPLAVGLIAFGAGLLAASLIPASSKEKDVASTVKEKAQPLVEEAQDVAKQIGEDLQEPAQDAAAAVNDAATDAVDTVKAEATDAGTAVKEQAQQAQENVSDA